MQCPMHLLCLNCRTKLRTSQITQNENTIQNLNNMARLKPYLHIVSKDPKSLNDLFKIYFLSNFIFFNIFITSKVID